MFVSCCGGLFLSGQSTGVFCYNIYSFIDGADAKDIMRAFTEEEQYKIGMEAGIQVSRVHSYEVPSTVNNWYDRAMEKHYRYLFMIL
ncbi:hypothetical protein P4S91_10300 [Aneurinibacillus aneurinilyticus]|uniref:hypothetical protein n=1 Tax=Aneurinibacillus aneurinilyticus TaxID=1391 RepID=UPI002E1A1E72|nr:hypothetical protein [Aneurinibacillus aneurinilyticus]MED0723306.1 hypothetical protein [Aneurinibacillus aneurinilyticus]